MNDDLLAPGLPPPDHDPRPSSSLATVKTVAAIGGLLLAAFGFALFGIGYGLGWWGHGGETPTEPLAQAQATTPDAPEPESPPAFAGGELTPEVDPLAAPVEILDYDEPLPGSEPVPEIEPPPSERGGSGGGSAAGDSGSGGGSGGGAGGGSGRKSGGPRVTVTVVLKHYDHVDIKLGGKVFSLDGDKTIKLRPGGYRVELRKSADAPWKPAGLVDIKLGSSYRVTLLEPPFAKVEVLP